MIVDVVVVMMIMVMVWVRRRTVFFEAEFAN